MGVTNLALQGIISDVIDSYSTAFTHIAVGDDDTTPVVSDTALGNETYRDALFEALTETTFSVSGAIFLDTTENNGNEILECGVFNAASGGDLLTRNLTNSIDKTSSIQAFVEVIINLEIENT